MMKSRDSESFSSIGSIVKELGNSLDLDRGLKISALAQKWPKIVGSRFEKCSKIFSVQEKSGFDIITVAVSSSSVSQELTFYKNDIIKNIYKKTKGLGFNVKDIHFSTKFWKEEENEN